MITIVSPVYIAHSHRVEYHKRFLECCKNQMDFDKIKFVFFYEKDILDYSVIEDLKTYSNIDLHINESVSPQHFNQYNCLKYCFEHLNLEHVIYVDDDVEMSNDIFDISNFYINSNKYSDNSIFCYLNKSNLATKKETKSDLIEIKDFIINGFDQFTPWGCLITKRVWHQCLKYCEKKISFDWEIVKGCKDTYKIVTPQESRINHIGVIGMNYNEELFRCHNFANYKVKQYDNRINYSYV